MESGGSQLGSIGLKNLRSTQCIHEQIVKLFHRFLNQSSHNKLNERLTLVLRVVLAIVVDACLQSVLREIPSCARIASDALDAGVLSI